MTNIVCAKLLEWSLVKLNIRFKLIRNVKLVQSVKSYASLANTRKPCPSLRFQITTYLKLSSMHLEKPIQIPKHHRSWRKTVLSRDNRIGCYLPISGLKVKLRIWSLLDWNEKSKVIWFHIFQISHTRYQSTKQKLMWKNNRLQNLEEMPSMVTLLLLSKKAIQHYLC